MNTKAKRNLFLALALMALATLACTCGWGPQGFYFSSEPVTAPTAIERPAVQPSGPAVQTDNDCWTKALELGAPTGSNVCSNGSGQDTYRVESNVKVPFGTITFDDETRVWILEQFITPSAANYSYNYPTPIRVLQAPFVTGAELSPVTKERFKICWDTVSTGCIPPVQIKFYAP